MNPVFRKGLLLALSGWVPTVNAQEETTPAPAAPAAAQPAESQDGRAIYSIPSLKPQWQARAVLNRATDKLKHLTADEDVVVAQSMSGVITVLNSENGREYWSSHIGRTNDATMPAATDSQLLAVITGPTIHAFEKFTGRRLFSYRMPQSPSAAPIIFRREVTYGTSTRMLRWIVVPMIDGSIVSFDVESLERMGRLGTLPDDVWRGEQWRFVISEDVRFSVLAGSSRLGFATGAGNIYSIMLSGSDAGQGRFQFIMKSGASAPPVLAVRGTDERVVSATKDGRLFCVDLNSAGRMHWGLALAAPVMKPMLAVQNDLYFVTHDGVLAKHDILSGDAGQISSGTGAVASQSESSRGELRAYGALVEANIDGLTAFAPFRIANRSTQQEVRSISIDLSRTALTFTASAADPAVPAITVLGDGRESTGMTGMTLSPDQKLATLEFTGFDADEYLYLNLGLQHPELPVQKIADSHLAGADIRALVAPKRAASAIAAGAAEAYPPRTIKGRLSTGSRPWKVSGVASILAASEATIYCEDLSGSIVGINRSNGSIEFSMNAADQSIRLFNDRTDRVITSTLTGQITLWAERRIQYGVTPIPIAGAFTWVVTPVAELQTDFARYHRNPEQRPLMPDVPAREPQVATAPEESGAGG